mgnify:CR=1 FL=1
MKIQDIKNNAIIHFTVAGIDKKYTAKIGLHLK